MYNYDDTVLFTQKLFQESRPRVLGCKTADGILGVLN